MDIWNVTKGNKIVVHVFACTTLLQKARGLMFRKQTSLLFVETEEKYIPLHMFFVFYPIDVIYLNKKKEVVECKERLYPFTFYTPKKKAQYVLEVQQNTIKSQNIEVGDILHFSL